MRFFTLMAWTISVCDASSRTNEESDAGRKKFFPPSMVAGLITSMSRNNEDTCAIWLVTHIKDSLNDSGDLHDRLLMPQSRPRPCDSYLPHPFVYLSSDDAEHIARGLIRKARSSDGDANFQTALVDTARTLLAYLPPKTKNVAKLHATQVLTSPHSSDEYGHFCRPSEPDISLPGKFFSQSNAPFYKRSRAQLQYNYVLPLIKFIVRMTMCGEVESDGIVRLRRLSLDEYKTVYGNDGLKTGPLAGEGMTSRDRKAVTDKAVAAPLKSEHVDTPIDSVETAATINLDDAEHREVPAVVPVVVPETPKDDIIAEQGTLQSQTSRLTRVASNVLKTWGMMRTAGIDAIDAVATVAMLADYADLVQQICYHLGNIATSSSDVDKMIEVTLARVNDVVLKEKPELLLLHSGESTA